MPSSRFRFGIDLALALAFVAVCAYARRVELGRLAPLASGPSIGTPDTTVSQAAALPVVAATSPKAGSVKTGQAENRSTGGSITAAGAPDIAGPPSPSIASLPAQVESLQSCGTVPGSPCSFTAADVAASTSAVTNAKISASDEDDSSNESLTPIRDIPITQLYASMLGTPVVVVGNSRAGGEIYGTDSPIGPIGGFTPVYPWEAQLGTPFVASPVPFSIMPPTIWLPDAPRKDDPTKKIGDGGDSDRRYSGVNDVKNHPNHPPVTATPEPATLTLLGTGIAALGTLRRRRKTIAAA